uniref:E3 ubiquitin-protein ligase AMFR n=1 Tax=Timema bartmani TaxID=61472 RepID=A0A7R9F620_9NEOP|nr:unnamed protein product [Timema bartmani]
MLSEQLSIPLVILPTWLVSPMASLVLTVAKHKFFADHMTLINMAYCCLILLGKFIQQLVFGELRVSEQQHIKDKFWNFVFYKFIFVFGVINVQYMDEVVLWCSWFSVLGFLHLLAQLCKDRFEYLSFSPTTPGWSHARLLGLLVAIFCLSGFMFLICVAVGFFGGLNTFAFMVAECVQLSVQTLHVIFRYVLHLYDMRQGGGSGGRVWEKRGPVAYYAELVFELAALLIDLVHHLHMLLWSNILLSMASLVICMQLRFLFHEIQRRIKKHRNYLWVLNHMEQNYPMASSEELSENSDNCAICWEKMESARKLPCTHLFHNSCLQSWLEQDSSCPTCRMVLSIQSPAGLEAANRMEHNLDTQGENQATPRRPPNHFFHFDGSRYVSWLPSFSVEVTHTQLLRSDQAQPAQTSQLDAMARQTSPAFRISFVVGMSSGSSSISSSPSPSLDYCYSLIISALSRLSQIVMSSSAAMYSSYVQPGANLCQVSSSHGRVKVRGGRRSQSFVITSTRELTQFPRYNHYSPYQYQPRGVVVSEPGGYEPEGPGFIPDWYLGYSSRKRNYPNSHQGLVQQLFPYLSLPTIVEDLRATRSVELTIENVLDGRVVAPPPMFQRDSDPPAVLDVEPVPAWEELCTTPETHQEESAETSTNLGGRFSKSSIERERILHLRKEQLLVSARRRYMERHCRPELQQSMSEDSSVRHRHINS